MNEPRQVQIPARDGYPLAATVFAPAAPAAKRAVVIGSAMATPQSYYRHFARALADAGYLAVTFDYRGIGRSGPASLRGFATNVRDWTLLDLDGVIDWLDETHQPARRFVVGHSLGGQVAGMLDNGGRIDGMVTVSSQSGYWRRQGGEQKAAVMLHVHVTLPVVSRALGYFPGKLLGSSVDLPKDAALQWARWCRDPEYLLGDPALPLERFRDFRAPVLAYSVDDDKWGTRESVDAMMGAYPNLERRHLVPREHGLTRLGHFGFFRPWASALWEEPLRWLDALATDAR
jgi:predicted alpha/beta hydrolase